MWCVILCRLASVISLVSADFPVPVVVGEVCGAGARSQMRRRQLGVGGVRATWARASVRWVRLEAWLALELPVDPILCVALALATTWAPEGAGVGLDEGGAHWLLQEEDRRRSVAAGVQIPEWERPRASIEIQVGVRDPSVPRLKWRHYGSRICSTRPRPSLRFFGSRI